LSHLPVPLPWFDIFILAVLLISAGVGFFRGAAREMLTVMAFVLATLAAVYGLRYSGPIARHAINPDWAGTVAAIVVVFVAVYIVLRLIGAALASKIQGTQVLGLLDRTIGLGFGLIRALVVLGALNIAFHAATPPERTPMWMSNAALYPLTTASADVLKAFAPKGMTMADRFRPALTEAVREGSTNAPRDSRDARGYDARERNSVDDLVEKSR
jgi:membrane protein required for colicin V production